MVFFPSLAPQSYYILGPYYTNPQPAHQAITRSSVYNNPGVTTQSIARLAAKRLVELEGLRKGTLGITIPPPSSLYSSVTLGQLVSLFLAAGAVSPLQVCLSVGRSDCLSVGSVRS